ncbi:MAG: DUF4185 domain-containing protein [Myxococcaceae bacterium]
MTAVYRWALLLATLAQTSCGSCGRPAIAAAVVAARDLGPMEQAAIIRGRDGGYSGRFRGRSVWLFGDTILRSKGTDGTSWRNNTGPTTADLTGSDGVSGFEDRLDAAGAPLEFFPQTAAERSFNTAHSRELQGDEACQAPCGARYALWPGPLVEDPESGRALIAYTKIYGEPGEWNFHSVGMGIATWAGLDEPVERPEVSPAGSDPTMLFGEGEPQFASAAVVRDGQLYLFGCGTQGLAKPCRLARAPLAEVFQRDAWRFFAGGQRWSESAADAATLFEAMDMTSVHWNKHLGAWLAFYSEPFSNRVLLRTAPQLTGPWSEPVVAFEALAPTDGDSSHVAYSGLGHADYARDDGRFEYVSYYRGTAPWEGEVRLVEVELTRRK